VAVQPEPDFTDRIREAALQLFNERGYGSATVEAIAHAAGVGVGTIYRRWPDKPALANDVFAWVESSIIEAVTGKPLEARTGKQQFLELWRRTWDFSARHPDRVVFVEGHTHEAFLDDENRAMKDRFLQHIARRFDQIGLRASPELAVSMITGTIVQLIRNRVKADPNDLGERLWAALRAESH
jgi:AcrR family transcriptional regulator